MASPTPTPYFPPPHRKSTASCQSLIVATRYTWVNPHLLLQIWTKGGWFYQFCAESCSSPEGSTMGVLAVDATPKIAGYDLVEAVQAACDKAMAAALRRRRRRPLPLRLLHCYQ
jgi:hypothetical protein